MINKKFKLFLLAVLVFTGVIYKFVTNDEKTHIAKSETKPKVYYDLVKISDVKKYISFPSTISANIEIPIVAEISGKILAINIKSGSNVETNQVIIEIDDRIYKSAVNKQKASNNYHFLQLQRFSKLVEKNILSKKLYDEALSKYESSKSALSEAEYNLNNTKISAPFKGTIFLQDLSVGEYVEKGKKLFTLFNFDKLKANFYISQSSINEIKLGQKVKLSLPNLGEIVGYVSFISPIFEQDSNSIKIEAIIDNSKEKYGISNSFAEALVKIPVKNVTLVSEDALNYERDKIYVFTVNEGKVSKKYVEIGPKYKKYFALFKGLNIDDQVVVRGQINLKDGMEVDSEKFENAETTENIDNEKLL